MGDIKGQKESKGNFQNIVSPKKSTKKLQILFAMLMKIRHVDHIHHNLPRIEPVERVTVILIPANEYHILYMNKYFVNFLENQLMEIDF